jgi:hypothetical protein
MYKGDLQASLAEIAFFTGRPSYRKAVGGGAVSTFYRLTGMELRLNH